MCRLQPAQGWQLPNYNATIGTPWLERGGQYVEARWNRCKCVLTVSQETSSYERSFEHLSRSSHSNPWHVFRVLAFVWMLCLTEISVGKQCRAKEAKETMSITCLFVSSTLNVLHVHWISWHLGTWQVNLRGGGEFGPDWERAGRFAAGRLKAYEAGNTWTLSPQEIGEKHVSFMLILFISVHYVWYVLCVFMSPWFKVGLIGRFDYKPVQVISALEFWHFHGTKPKSVKHVVTGMIFSFVVSGVVRVSHFSKTAGICWNLPLVMVASLGRAEWRVYGVLFFTACLQPKVRALQLSSSTIFNYSRIYGMFDHNFLAMPFTAICSCEMYASSQET